MGLHFAKQRRRRGQHRRHAGSNRKALQPRNVLPRRRLHVRTETTALAPRMGPSTAQEQGPPCSSTEPHGRGRGSMWAPTLESGCGAGKRGRILRRRNLVLNFLGRYKWRESFILLMQSLQPIAPSQRGSDRPSAAPLSLPVNWQG
jgi:hypothetical protein